MKSAPIVKKATPAKEAVKEPKKAFRFNIHTLEYYGKETVTFKESEVENSHCFQFIKCKDTVFVIEGKIKTVMLENCINCTVVANEVMANIELINCKKIKV